MDLLSYAGLRIELFEFEPGLAESLHCVLVVSKTLCILLFCTQRTEPLLYSRTKHTASDNELGVSVMYNTF